MQTDQKWIVVRIDGRIAGVSTDYRVLAKITKSLATASEAQKKADSKPTNTSVEPIIYKEVSATAVTIDDVLKLKAEIQWDDLLLFGTDFQKKVWRKLWDLTHQQANPDTETTHQNIAEENAETENGTGNKAEAGTEAGAENETGNGAGAGNGVGAGNKAEAGTEAGAEAGAEAGEESEKGSRAETKTGNVARAGKKAEAGEENEKGSREETGEETGIENGAGNGTENGAGNKAEAGTEAGAEAGAESGTGSRAETRTENEAGDRADRAEKETGSREDKVGAGKKTLKLYSYSDFAELCDNRAGVRAVAHAIGLNPISVLIPCHLVVPKESIDRIREIQRKAESTIFKGEDLCLSSILADTTIDFGEYSLGKSLKRALISLDLS